MSVTLVLTGVSVGKQTESEASGQKLFGSIKAPGRYAGGAITAASWVVTVPAGSEFVCPTPNGAARVKLDSAASITGDGTNNKVSLVVGPTGGDSYGAVLVADTAGVSGGLLLGTVNNNTWTDEGVLDKTSQDKQVYTAFVPSLTVDQSVFIPVANGGTVRRILVAANAQPSDTVTFTGKIGGVAITNGAPTVLSSTVAGVVRSATPTAANTVLAGESVEVAMGHATNANAGTAVVTIEVDE